MNEKPLVSIVIPFFNAQKFIEETIESVFAQTYSRWELLLVDDGSTDTSTEIALDYANQYPDKVYYFEHPKHQNKGSSSTRNLGIRNSKGKYVATLDADDVWLPNKLEDQVSIMESNPEIGMVFGDTKSWYSWTGDVLDKDLDYYEYDRMKPNSLKLNTVIKPPTLLILRLSGKIVSPSMSNNLFRKKVLEYVGGFEEIFTGLHDDQVLWAKIFLNSQVYVSESCWDFYRRHPDSSVSIAKKEGRVRSAELFYLSWLENYLSEKHIANKELLSVVQKRKWRADHPRLHELSKFKGKIYSYFKRIVKRTVCYLLPLPIIHLSLSTLLGKGYRPPVGCVCFGDLYRLTPISKNDGVDRGTPINKYYTEKFFDKYSKHITGRVLEIAFDDNYARKFGGDRVTKIESLDLIRSVNFASAKGASPIPMSKEGFDCIICKDTLEFNYDIRSAINVLYGYLKPGGIILASIRQTIDQKLNHQPIKAECLMRLTSSSVKKLFEEQFPDDNLDVSGYGNLLTLTGLHYGLSAEDIKQKDLDIYDPNYEIVIAIKAVKRK